MECKPVITKERLQQEYRNVSMIRRLYAESQNPDKVTADAMYGGMERILMQLIKELND